MSSRTLPVPRDTDLSVGHDSVEVGDANLTVLKVTLDVLVGAQQTLAATVELVAGDVLVCQQGMESQLATARLHQSLSSCVGPA